MSRRQRPTVTALTAWPRRLSASAIVLVDLAALDLPDPLASPAGSADPFHLGNQRTSLRAQFRRALVDRRSGHPGQFGHAADSTPA
jgi:hypothetical protein